MTRHINIIILAIDRYFYLGLTSLLQQHFVRKDWTVTFLPEYQTVQADLIIRVDKKYGPRHTPPPSRRPAHQKVITLWDTTFRHGPLPACLSAQGLLCRHDRGVGLLQFIDSWGRASNVYTPYITPQNELMLTPREWEVLSILRREQTPQGIASYLGISIKTVSQHKRNAMHKLGFHRNCDLYHWLQQGGLMSNFKEYICPFVQPNNVLSSQLC
jgi:fimbrial protein FimW